LQINQDEILRSTEEDFMDYTGGEGHLLFENEFSKRLEVLRRNYGDVEAFGSWEHLQSLVYYASLDSSKDVDKIFEVLRHIESGEKVLDYGCGVGTWTFMMRGFGYDVVGACDIEGQALEFVRWRNRKHRSRIDIFPIPWTNLPEFDCLVAIYTLDYEQNENTIVELCTKASKIVCLLLDHYNHPYTSALPGVSGDFSSSGERVRNIILGCGYKKIDTGNPVELFIRK